MIGGALAKPVDSLPSIFQPGSLWDRFPYLLPNLFSACCVFFGVIIGLLFLEETHAEKKQRRDRGVELGKCILSYLSGKGRKSKGKVAVNDAEEQPLLSDTDESLPGYLSDGSDAATVAEEGRSSLDETCVRAVPKMDAKPVTKIFTKPVLTIIASYGILAL
jgi:hypothetical protein